MWFHCSSPSRSASHRLFCFPHAGGSAAFFHPWAKDFATAIELHAVQYPGRAGRIAEPLIDDANELAELVTGAMSPLLDRPVGLFGHSMGGTIAYEVARLLSERGNLPVHLFVSSARAPHDRADIEQHAEKDDTDLIAHLSKLGDTNADALSEPELCEIVMPYIRNDFKLIETYKERPGPRLTFPVTALTGNADPFLDADRASKWREVTTSKFTLRVLPGDHFYLVPQRSKVIDDIQRTLLDPQVPPEPRDF
jgi:surfactin synthase thioesterase subunit